MPKMFVFTAFERFRSGDSPVLSQGGLTLERDRGQTLTLERDRGLGDRGLTLERDRDASRSARLP